MCGRREKVKNTARLLSEHLSLSRSDQINDGLTRARQRSRNSCWGEDVGGLESLSNGTAMHTGRVACA